VSLARRARAVLAATGTAWAIVGLSLLLVLALDLAAATYYHLRSASSDGRWTRDAFRGEPWMGDFLREHQAADALDWHSYVYWRHKPHQGHYINVDGRGIRASWRDARPLDAKPIRIFVFGGSTMWGTGARDDFTIASQLAKKLADHLNGRPVEVTNFGELGYVSTQELLALELELRRGNVPDAVIFYDGVNDLGAAYQEGEPGIPQNELNRRIDFERPVASFVYGLMRESALLRPILWRIREQVWRSESAKRSAEQEERLARDAVLVYAANLSIIDGLARDFGFRALYFWQPVIFTKRHLTPDEQQAAAENGFMRDFFERANGMRRDAGLLDHPGFHDISGIFDGVEEPIYFDFVHIAEHGNEMVAEAMLPHVAALLAPLEMSAPPQARR
jgi:lysophospholipase L1-like esterase